MGKGPAAPAGLPPEVTGEITGCQTAQLALRLDKPQKKLPERRCIVTGESVTRSSMDTPLLRFAAAPDGNLVFDAAEKLPGRGCYVSADPVLLQHAIDKKLFARALKGKVMLPADLADLVTSQLTARILAALGLAKKSGMLAVGEEAVEQSVTRGTALLALAASDASPRTAADLATKAGRHHIEFIALPVDAATLGAALGRDNTVYLTLLKSKGGQVGNKSGTGAKNTTGAALTRDCARLAPFVTTLTQNTARKAGQKVEQ